MKAVHTLINDRNLPSLTLTRDSLLKEVRVITQFICIFLFYTWCLSSIIYFPQHFNIFYLIMPS